MSVYNGGQAAEGRQVAREARGWGGRNATRAGGRERDEGRRGETTPLSLRSFSCVRPVVRDFRTVAGLVDVLCDVGGIFGRFGGCAFGGDACAVVGAAWGSIQA